MRCACLHFNSDESSQQYYFNRTSLVKIQHCNFRSNSNLIRDSCLTKKSGQLGRILGMEGTKTSFLIRSCPVQVDREDLQALAALMVLIKLISSVEVCLFLVIFISIFSRLLFKKVIVFLIVPRDHFGNTFEALVWFTAFPWTWSRMSRWFTWPSRKP